MLRLHLVSLLKGGNAHVRFEDVVKGFPVSKINADVPNLPYTPWQLLEHMRITQFDILDFARNPKYKYMKWPKDYWPNRNKNATGRDWKNSIKLFNKDCRDLQGIANNTVDLYAKIPWGTGQTILREILLVADHNAYHLGELLMMRRLLGAWQASR